LEKETTEMHGKRNNGDTILGVCNYALLFTGEEERSSEIWIEMHGRTWCYYLD